MIKLPQESSPITIFELTRRIKSLLEARIGTVWVEGEISNVKSHFSGHIYLSLKDDKAQIRAVMFKQSARLLKFLPEDGQQVIVRGRLAVYEPRGDYQIIIDQMEPSGIGALQLAFLQLKEKLEKEGLFASERKKPIPALPRRVGVVTSPTGAAIRDFLNVVRRRFSNIDVLISPAAVQGDGAPAEIVSAIEKLNLIGNMDVIVITRGGGSMEDLWAFNEEIVARAIYASQIPIISAIGHEVDFTIADFVADLRAPTPSAAAEMLVESKKTHEYRISSIRLRLVNAMRSLIAGKNARLTAELRAMPDPIRRIRELGQRVDDMSSLTANQMRSNLALAKTRFENAAGRLAALNPLATLNRGYSIVTKLPGKKMLTDASKVAPGDRLNARLRRGHVLCEVLETYCQEESLFPAPDS